MSMGAPHCESQIFQWECGNCGKCIGETRTTIDYSPHRIKATANPYDGGGITDSSLLPK